MYLRSFQQRELLLNCCRYVWIRCLLQLHVRGSGEDAKVLLNTLCTTALLYHAL